MRKRKSIVLIITLITVILCLGVANVIFMRVNSQINNLKHKEASMQALYLAEKGMQYAYIESQLSGWTWRTHSLDADSNIQTASAPVRSLNNTTINDEGVYVINDPLGNIEVKTYPAKDDSEDTVILSRATVNGETKILRKLVSKASLFSYFYFTPGNFPTSGAAYYGKGLGSIHANGGLTLYAQRFYDFYEISLAGDIKSAGSSMPHPNGYTPTAAGNGWVKYPTYSTSYDKYTYPFASDSSRGVAVTGTNYGPCSSANIRFYSYGDHAKEDYTPVDGEWNSGRVKVNDKLIPRTISSSPTTWKFPKYAATSARTINPIKFEVTDDMLHELINIEKSSEQYKDPSKWRMTGPYSSKIVTVLAQERENSYTANNGDTQRVYNLPGVSLKIHKEGNVEVVKTTGSTSEGGKILGGLTEYNLYTFVEKYLDGDYANTEVLKNAIKTQINNNISENSDYSDDISEVLTTFITGGNYEDTTGDRVSYAGFSDESDFFSWWKERDRKNAEDLVPADDLYRFATDTIKRSDGTYVPAWERTYWEAWLNWLPTVDSQSKMHNDIREHGGWTTAYNYEWWQDLEYGTDVNTSGDATELDCPFLNSAYQGQEIYDWMQANPDSMINADGETVLKYRGFGGEEKDLIEIESYYVDLAKANGLYIYEDTAAKTFTVTFKGLSSKASSLTQCLSDVGIADWVTYQTFYNPLYEPTNYGQYLTSTVAEEGYIVPKPTQVINIDVNALKSATGVDWNTSNKIVYIETKSYDTRIKNAAIMPDGGITIVSPYDVYVQAQAVSESQLSNELGVSVDLDGDGIMNESDSEMGLFNYEYADYDVDDEDTYTDPSFKGSAVITNSSVRWLSSEFKDQMSGNVYPYPSCVPVYYDRAKDNKFLQNYCYDVWTGNKPASKYLFTSDWISENLTTKDSIKLIDQGSSQWVKSNIDYINSVELNQKYNVAVASSNSPEGTYCEFWKDYFNVKDSPVSWGIEGSLIKVPSWSSKYRSTTSSNALAFNKNRFKNDFSTIPYSTSSLYSHSYLTNNYWTSITELPKYEFEERFFNADGRPTGDMFSGSESSHIVVASFDKDIL
ncbi:MAG: hypothetical protein WC214_01945 [Candidatus Omnitrophota bacterium]|nr:hypothetical protein [Candidatus Omnitrophota bacterium]